MNPWISLLAQAATQPTGTQTAPQGGGDPGTLLWGMMLAIIVFWFIMMRGQRKDRKKHEDMLRNLKRNDRVQTIGGVYGTVVEVRDMEVVLKVDETANVKMRFNRGAIKEVLSPAPNEPSRT